MKDKWKIYENMNEKIIINNNTKTKINKEEDKE